MDKSITEIILHMAKSHEELANVIEAKRSVVQHVSQLNNGIPEHGPDFGDIETLMEHSLLVTKSITSFLNSLADLEEAMGENLSVVMVEMEDQPSDE